MITNIKCILFRKMVRFEADRIHKMYAIGVKGDCFREKKGFSIHFMIAIPQIIVVYAK